MGPFTLPISAHLPLMRARPGSVTLYVVRWLGPATQEIVKTGKPLTSIPGAVPVPVAALNGPAFATPMFSGSFTE